MLPGVFKPEHEARALAEALIERPTTLGFPISDLCDGDLLAFPALAFDSLRGMIGTGEPVTKLLWPRGPRPRARRRCVPASSPGASMGKIRTRSAPAKPKRIALPQLPAKFTRRPISHDPEAAAPDPDKGAQSQMFPSEGGRTVIPPEGRIFPSERKEAAAPRGGRRADLSPRGPLTV